MRGILCHNVRQNFNHNFVTEILHVRLQPLHG